MAGDRAVERVGALAEALGEGRRPALADRPADALALDGDVVVQVGRVRHPQRDAPRLRPDGGLVELQLRAIGRE